MRVLLIITCAAWLLNSPPAPAAPPDFVTQIAPIFQARCLECHGPEKQKGKLRLDQKQDLFSHPEKIVVPGKADESILYKLIILPKDHDDIMPAKGEPLTKEQTDLIRDWINQGAPWPDSFVVGLAPAPAATPSLGGESAAQLRAAAAELRALAAQLEAAAATLEGKPTPVVKREPAPEELAALAKAREAQAQAMAELEKLTGVGLRPVAKNTSALEANFRAAGTNLTDAALVPLAKVFELTDLDLAGTKVTDAGLASLQVLTNLLTLHLENTGITDAGLAHLKNLSQLTYLNLYGTAVTDAGLEPLRSLANLKKLYLWQTKVSSEGAKKLQSMLPHLQISRGDELTPKPTPDKNDSPPAKSEEKK